MAAWMLLPSVLSSMKRAKQLAALLPDLGTKRSSQSLLSSSPWPHGGALSLSTACATGDVRLLQWVRGAALRAPAVAQGVAVSKATSDSSTKDLACMLCQPLSNVLLLLWPACVTGVLCGRGISNSFFYVCILSLRSRELDAGATNRNPKPYP